MTAFDHINRYYGLSLRVGSRVEYTGDKDKGPQQGSVTSADGAHINIRFDGSAKTRGPFHPTWEMRCLDIALLSQEKANG